MTADAFGPPRPATVIAIGLQPHSGAMQSRQETRRAFTTLMAGALAHNCSLQPASGVHEELAMTGIVPDHAQTLSLIRRMQSVQEEFHRTYPDTAMRFVVHHGVVFRSAKGESGSAIRSAHSRLARLPENIYSAATTDFVAFSATWPSRSISFDDIPSLPEGLGLLTFSTALQEVKIKQGLSNQPTGLLSFLTARLANHIGPFAEVLVSAAERSSATPHQLIEELSREIDDPKARQTFLTETRAFLEKS